MSVCLSKYWDNNEAGPSLCLILWLLSQGFHFLTERSTERDRMNKERERSVHSAELQLCCSLQYFGLFGWLISATSRAATVWTFDVLMWSEIDVMILSSCLRQAWEGDNIISSSQGSFTGEHETWNSCSLTALCPYAASAQSNISVQILISVVTSLIFIGIFTISITAALGSQ